MAKPVVAMAFMTALVLQWAPAAWAQCPTATEFALPVVDDDPSDNLTWDVPFNYFGNYYAALGGFHPGEDWNLVGGSPDADLGKPVYPVAPGRVAKVSPLGSLGYLVAVMHNGTFTIPGRTASEEQQQYAYPMQVVNVVYSIYMHVANLPSQIVEGACVNRGTALGFIMNPGGGPHVHLEIRTPDATHSNNWSLVGAPSNWAYANGAPSGYYLNLQAMVDAGMRHPREFLAANAGTTPGAVPGPPENLTSSVVGTAVSLSWTAPRSGGVPTSYVVEAGSSSGASNIASVSLPASMMSFAATAPAGTYFMRVRARNAAGVSAPSNEVQFAAGTGGAPGRPTLTASVSGNTVSANWTAGPGAPPTSYFVAVGRSPGASDVFAQNVGLVTSGTGVLPNGSYFIRVTASNGAGTSAPSNEVTVMVGQTGPPPNVSGTWRLTRTGTWPWILTYSSFTVTLLQSGSTLTGSIRPDVGSTAAPIFSGSVSSSGAVVFGTESPYASYWNDYTDAYFRLSLDSTGNRMSGNCTNLFTCTSATAVRIR